MDLVDLGDRVVQMGLNDQVGQVGLAVTAPRGPNVRAAPSES